MQTKNLREPITYRTQAGLVGKLNVRPRISPSRMRVAPAIGCAARGVYELA